MRRSRVVQAVIVAGGVAIGVAGCASSSPARSTRDATTPQDKAHQEHLADLSSEDAEAAGQRPPEPDRTPRQRRTGQQVIDQPVRR